MIFEGLPPDIVKNQAAANNAQIGLTQSPSNAVIKIKLRPSEQQEHRIPNLRKALALAATSTQIDDASKPTLEILI